jgi:hypothetical protein
LISHPSFFLPTPFPSHQFDRESFSCWCVYVLMYMYLICSMVRNTKDAFLLPFEEFQL